MCQLVWRFKRCCLASVPPDVFVDVYSKSQTRFESWEKILVILLDEGMILQAGDLTDFADCRPPWWTLSWYALICPDLLADLFGSIRTRTTDNLSGQFVLTVDLGKSKREKTRSIMVLFVYNIFIYTKTK